MEGPWVTEDVQLIGQWVLALGESNLMRHGAADDRGF